MPLTEIYAIKFAESGFRTLHEFASDHNSTFSFPNFVWIKLSTSEHLLGPHASAQSLSSTFFSFVLYLASMNFRSVQISLLFFYEIQDVASQLQFVNSLFCSIKMQNCHFDLR